MSQFFDFIQGAVSDKVATRIKRQTYTIESEQEAQEEEFSAFDEVKSVSKSLMKAIVKPTVSHISDAYKWREVRKFFQKPQFSLLMTELCRVTMPRIPQMERSKSKRQKEI